MFFNTLMWRNIFFLKIIICDKQVTPIHCPKPSYRAGVGMELVLSVPFRFFVSTASALITQNMSYLCQIKDMRITVNWRIFDYIKCGLMLLIGPIDQIVIGIQLYDFYYLGVII